MISRNIVSVLNNYGYNMMKSSNPKYLFFSKQTDEAFSTTVLIDDENDANSINADLLNSIKESLENTLLLRGFKRVDVLFIIFSTNPFAYKELAEQDFTFWVADTGYKRIISYTSDDGDFALLRDSFEQALYVDTPAYSTGYTKKAATIKKPIITISLAVINILIFLYFDLFCDMAESTVMYFRFSSEWSTVLEGNEYYRLFTSMFLHFDMTHLSGNMITLFAIGLQLEPYIGHIKYLIIYLLSGLMGSLSSVLYHCYLGESVLSAGASGAIFGVFGAYAIYALFEQRKGKSIPAMRIAMISLLMLLNGMTSGTVDNAAHLGGIITGCIISFICCICSKNKI